MIMIPEIGEIPRFPVIPLEKNQFRDGVLVRTPNWLGDAVMAIPAIRQIRSILPEYCGLFVVTPAPLEGLFDSLDFVDRIILLRNAHAFPSRSERNSIDRLHAGAGILFNNSFRDALALRLSGVPRLFGAAARFRSLLLKRSFHFPPRLDHELNKPHQAAKYMSIVLSMGAEEWDGVFPELNPLCFEETFSDDLRKAMALKKTLAVAAGAAYGQAKCWAQESFAEVCRRWVSEEQGNVILLGSTKERQAGEVILNGISADRCVNLAGETSLQELICILKHSDVCLANDSGVMHLAAACGIPGVAPFGSTDPSATSPVSKKWHLIYDKQPCSPCFKRVCPKGTKECFRSITPDIVLNELKSIINP